ncbi:C-type lectin domain family 10 member A-like [Mercenaria mercenaria]|uniref:C-type lectin domain family 10 member A-like n=1 Tax=Mercenaria mercenaria TaxID=6596 RepID=UPI00234EFF84|nr:C-type lectin domain family 10 member A-like [Mercenaria mercenaria]
MNIVGILGLVTIFAYVSLSEGEEQQCSRYHYEEQTLSKILRLEQKLELLENIVKNTKGSEWNVRGRRCPDGWISFQGSCYLFQHTSKDFVSAELFCVEYNAHLVRIDSEIENTFLKNHLKELKDAHYSIGLTDVETEGTFKWYGTDDVASFTDWGSGQPDNYGGGQDCALFHYGIDFKWDDGGCSSERKFICEKKAD